MTTPERIEEALAWVEQLHTSACDDYWDDPEVPGGIDCACGGRRYLAALREAQADNERLREAAEPFSRLPFPVSSDERDSWRVYQQRLISAMSPPADEAKHD